LNPRTSKPVANIPASLDYRLQVYSLAAAAAGVGLLALADPPARAEIVYTPAHQYIPANQYGFIDFNHDGANDLRLYLFSDSYKIVERLFSARASQQGGVAGYVGGTFLGGGPVSLASALTKGVPIGSKANFLRDPLLAGVFENHYDGSSTSSVGPWRNVKARYLGVKFNIDGEVHYGWVRIGVSDARRMDIIVTGYAYETVANRPIRAGQTSSGASEAEDSTVAPETVSVADLPLNIRPDSLPLSLGVLALGAIGREP
jgi:hypothetical protein